MKAMNLKANDQISGAFEGSNEIIPDALSNDTFNLEQEFNNFNALFQAQDIENAQKVIVNINKFIRNSHCSLDLFKTEEVVTILIQIIEMKLEGSYKFLVLPIKKEVFSLLIYIIRESQDIASYLVSNQIFPRFGQLLTVTEDTFTSNLVLEIFKILMDYGPEIIQEALKENLLSNLVNAFDFYTKQFKIEYTAKISAIVQLLFRVLDFPDFVDESAVNELFGRIFNYLNVIYQRVLPKGEESDYYISQVRATKSEIDFLEIISDCISNLCETSFDKILPYVIKSNFVSLLNSFVLNVNSTSRSWSHIFSMDNTILSAFINAEQEEPFLQIIEMIKPAAIFKIYTTHLTFDGAMEAFQLFFTIIHAKEELVESFDIQALLERTVEEFEDLKINIKTEVIRFIMAIVAIIGPEITNALLESGLLQAFNSVFCECDESLQIFSILSFSSCLEKYQAEKQNSEQIIEFLNDEYKSFLEEWASSPNSTLCEAATSFLEMIETE